MNVDAQTMVRNSTEQLRPLLAVPNTAVISIGIVSRNPAVQSSLRKNLEEAQHPVIDYVDLASVHNFIDVVFLDCCTGVDTSIQTTWFGAEIPIVALVENLNPASYSASEELGAVATISMDEIDGLRPGLTLRQLSRLDCFKKESGQDAPAALRDQSWSMSPDELDSLEIAQIQSDNRSLAALNSVALSLMDKLELEELLQRIASTVVDLTKCDSSYISMVHESGSHLHMVASGGGFEEMKGFVHRPGEGVAGTAWETNRIVFVEDYPRSEFALSKFTWISEACALPIVVSDKIIGIIGITYKEKGSQIQKKFKLLEEFSTLAGLAIENATLLETTAIELKRTETIRQLSQAIYNSLSFDSLFDRISVTLIDVFNLKSVSVNPWEKKRNTFSISHQWTRDDDGIHPTQKKYVSEMSEKLCEWTLENRKIAKIDREFLDERDDAQMRDLREEKGLGATVVLPLIHDAERWGAIVLHRSVEQRNFSKSDINLLDVLGNQISTAIHRHGLLNKIQHQAYHDSLTALPNRFSFEAVLDKLVADRQKEDPASALIFLDLDGFKQVNDTLGHAMGDELLKLVALRLAGCLKSTDTLARMGGDEFAILLPEIDNDQEAVTVAERLIESLGVDFYVNGARLTIGASAGISFCTELKSTANELLKSADIAMYQAKDDGKGRVHCFSEALSTRYKKRVTMEIDLKIAIEADQFELYYQPQVSTVSNEVEGVEALIRWFHPLDGLVSPIEFIPVAEECGLISDIGNWVLLRACQQIADWNAANGQTLSVACNISAEHFNQPDFLNIVDDALMQSQLDPELLHLEVTESVVMHDVSKVVMTLKLLRDKGVNVAVDDFGTGYSSLQYLQDLPLDTLKIDRAFIRTLDFNNGGSSVASTIVLLAQSFGLTTVAEGVETPDQLEIVTGLGCDSIQGYIYSKPVSIGELGSTVESINPEVATARRVG